MLLFTNYWCKNFVLEAYPKSLVRVTFLAHQNGKIYCLFGTRESVKAEKYGN